MLKLKDIYKSYDTGDSQVVALNGINIEFRKNEFVSILGPSGCGKTTLLNIIGGLDRYTKGDLLVNDVSTKQYHDGDWDIYRNRTIGFVFQSYNLIPHQTALANVELAMTLSGVSKSERRQKALAALTQVGLEKQVHKKPNQMSGGQMQRIAIARALVNDPEVLLADEPTGALDSETSVQIMELLKKVAKDRLVIMVTHNPALAKDYSTRIVRLLDGQITDDSNPYTPGSVEPIATGKKKLKEKKNKKKSLSMFTALSLSLNNLLTKKARTLLTGFAGSIGIIGIALILSISNGMQTYIDNVQQDTMSSYPLTMQKNNVDMNSMMTALMKERGKKSTSKDGEIASKDVMGDMLNKLGKKLTSNDLKSFKKYLESDSSGVKDDVNDIQYTYDTPMNIYKSDTTNGLYRIEPSALLDNMMASFSGAPASDTEDTSAASGAGSKGMGMMGGSNIDVWDQLMANNTVLKKQYDVLAGNLPKAWNEVVLITNENSEITDYTLYCLGIKDPKEVTQMTKNVASGTQTKVNHTSYTYSDLMKLTFKLLPATASYAKENGVWVDKNSDDTFMTNAVNQAEAVKVVGIIKPKTSSHLGTNPGGVGYTGKLMQHLLADVNASEVVTDQKAHPDTDIFSGKAFADATGAATAAQGATATQTAAGTQSASASQDTTAQGTTAASGTAAAQGSIDMSSLSAEQQAQLQSLSAEERAKVLASYSTTSNATYDGNMQTLGVADEDDPSAINIYPKDFSAKGKITDIIKKYNKDVKADGNEKRAITYTDYTEMLMSSVNSVIDGISYILIAFVGISLVVSSIMIGIITYISVLERTKEIGILRSIGASKGDISRVFNAETLIVGFVSGMLGIGITVLLCIPANAIIQKLADITHVAQLPVGAAVILVAISMVLTFIAGLIPAKIAAKKDPVVALRTE